MNRKFRSAISVTALAVGALMFGAIAEAAPAGVKVGVLTCNVANGWGFVFGSSRSLHCNYSPRPGYEEHYVGAVSKFGVDLGYTGAGVIMWGVVAPTTTLAPGSLAGNYGGVTGGATVGVGGDANVLIGGSGNSISLQPLSIEGNSGLNVAAGIAAINLQYQAPSVIGALPTEPPPPTAPPSP
jgi:hypothetical protein